MQPLNIEGHRKKVAGLRISRRRFLGAAGLGIGALALGGCGALTSQDPRKREDRSAGAGRVRKYALAAAPLGFEIGGREVST